MTFCIIGRGQMGSAFAQFFTSHGHTVVQPVVDVCDAGAVRDAVVAAHPDVVINAAAKTNIDWCEDNKQEAFAVNTLGAINAADAAKTSGAFFVQISSGCVQESTSGNDPRSEADPADPACFYSWTKVFADEMLLHRLQKGTQQVLILRPRQLLSAIPHPRNILAKFLTYNKFIDTDNSYTVIEDFVPVALGMIEKRMMGLYNTTNEGYLTPYKVALILKEYTKPEMQFEKITREVFDQTVRNKRVDCVLSTDKLKAAGFSLPPVADRLIELAKQLKENLATASDVMAKTEAETRAKIIS
ncbi:MAG: sugar nucleotide-binding protein [bacterium]|nr:sugar nucleotide-binding protein [bacterium]